MVEGGGSCIIFVHERAAFLATLSNIFSYLSIKKKRHVMCQAESKCKGHI